MPAILIPTSKPLPFLSQRQSQASKRSVQSGSTEACASTCMANTSEQMCESLDSACLCGSSAWQGSIVTCLQQQCEAQHNLDTAYDQFVTFCTESSKTFTLAEPSFTRTTATSIATSTPSDTTSQPMVINVSAIMAAVCTLFFVIGFIFGVVGVRDKLKHQKQMLENDSLKFRENSRRVELEDNTKFKSQMAQTLSGVGSSKEMVSVQLDGDSDTEERLDRLRQARIERAENAHAIRLEDMDRRTSASSSVESITASSDFSPTSSFSSYHPDSRRSKSISSMRYSSGYMEYPDPARKFCFDNKEDNRDLGRMEEKDLDEGLDQHIWVPSTNRSSDPQPFLHSGEVTPTRNGVFPDNQEVNLRDRAEGDISEFLYDDEADDERLTWGGRLSSGKRNRHW